MSLAMSQEEREAFLAEMHVGVIAINDPGRGPLTAPIWYDYEPGGAVRVLIGPESRKARLLNAGDRVSLGARQEAMPYRYVSVEGTVSLRPSEDGEILAMATRYLGEDMGRAYAEQNTGDNLTVAIDIERWLTVDYGKM